MLVSAMRVDSLFNFKSKGSADLSCRSAAFPPASARRFGSLLPPHGIARRLIACPGCGARSFMAATSS